MDGHRYRGHVRVHIGGHLFARRNHRVLAPALARCGGRLPLISIGGVSTYQYEHRLNPLPADDTSHRRVWQASLHRLYTPSATTMLVVENLLSSSLISA